MRKRLLHGFEMLMLVMVLMLAFRPARVQAASYRIATQSSSKKDRTAGNTVFDWQNSNSALYATTNGKRVKIYRAPTGYYIANEIISNGSDVYFIVSKNNGMKSIFFHCTVTGKNLKEIATGKSLGWPTLAGYYSSKLYFVDGSSEGNLYSLNVKTGKSKVVSRSNIYHIGIRQLGKYMVYTTFGSKICSYNLATGKTKTISDDVAVSAVAVDNTYVYFVKAIYKDTTSGSGYYACSVIRCKPDGSGKKTLLKNIKADSADVISITGSSVTYQDINGKQKTKKF